MKRTLFILTAAAGMLLLGGASAKADDGSWTITVAPSTGTFYRDSGGTSDWKDRWVSTESPTITIADADGSTTNNMTWDDTLDGITLAEGSGSSYSYTVSVEYGYLISGMTLKAKTSVSDMTLTVGETSQSLSANTEATFTLSDIDQQSVGITVSSSSGNNESVTLYNWTVTVVKDPDAKDFSVDLSQMKITAISEAITSLPEEGKWYLMKNDRHSYSTYGYPSPVYDNGEGSTMQRAADDNVVQVGDIAEDVAQYLLRFISADTTSTALAKSVVVNPQWATGNFWTSTLTTTSNFSNAGSYNMYLTSSTSGTNTFAFNLYDMQDIVDNNGVSGTLVTWGTGEVTATSNANNIWWLYEVTLEEMTEDDEEAVAQAERNEKLLEAIELAYDAYEANCGYKDLVLTDTVGKNLIKSADQLSSPYSQSETENTLGNLIDNNIGTYWESKWSSGSVDNGVHYIQVELPDDFEGGEIQVYIERRNDTYNNHITEMSVKGIVSDEYSREAAYRIALLELPYAFQAYQGNEEEYAGFTCPAGVKTLRFYEEATAGDNQYNVGFWHLAEFHLYASSLTDDCGNTTLKAEKKEALLTAIDTALKTYGNCTEEDIETLEEAISTYLKEDISWTLGADYGTLILPFNDDVSVEDNGLTVYPCSGVSDSEVQLGDAVDAIAPKTPYIVSGTANATTPITFSGEASFKTSLYSDAQGLLTGTLTGTTAPTGSYVLQNQTGTPAFYLVDSSTDITVGAYHCYLTLADESGEEGGVKAEVISFPSSGVATAIEAVDGITTDNEAIYDLSGRKVTNPRSGVYIKGGKKVIIK